MNLVGRTIRKVSKTIVGEEKSNIFMGEISRFVSRGTGWKPLEDGFFVPTDYENFFAKRDSNYVYPTLSKKFDQSQSEIEQLSRKLFSLAQCPAIQNVPIEKTDEDSPYWNNGFFGGADAKIAFGLAVHLKPKQIVEIGAGNSTKFFRLAIQTENLPTRITSIDPSPRANIQKISDRVITKSLLDVDPTFFEELEAGDILFYDGSHLVLPGSDVTHFFLEILPRVKPGVLVHIHDIFLPYEYGSEFQRRRYNEQHLLATMLIHSEAWQILCPIHYAFRNQFIPEDGGSFWIKRV